MSGFRHEALMYRNDEEYVAALVPFLRAALDADAPAMVAVDRDRAALLKDALGPDAHRITFLDMRRIGTNPGAIISAWQDFVARNGGASRRMWGIGEPAWPGRSDDEFGECFHHECLLNAAFAHAVDFHLICPYNAAALDRKVVERAWESHPFILDANAPIENDHYRDVETLAELLDEPLPPAPSGADEVGFRLETLAQLRRLIRHNALAAGVPAESVEDLVFALNELAENSVKHGAGHGTLRYWRDGRSLVCEVVDKGRIHDPLAGRRRPANANAGGYGLWLVHQVCDLVQVRSSPAGTVVRVHMRDDSAVATAA